MIVTNPKNSSYILLFVIFVILTTNLILSLIHYFDSVPKSLKNKEAAKFHMGLTHIILGAVSLVASILLLYPMQKMTTTADEEEEITFHRQ